MPQQDNSFIENLLVIAWAVGPFVLRMILGNSRLGIRIFDFFSRMRKRAQKEVVGEIDHEGEDVESVRLEMERYHENSMALYGSNVRELNMLNTALGRIDTTIFRMEENTASGFKALREYILDVAREIRNRQDSTLIHDTKLHQQQNESLKRHEIDIDDLKGRLKKAEVKLDDASNEIGSLRHRIDALSGGR